MRLSIVNTTLYTILFTAAARSTSRCELCFATTHTEKECAQQGHPDPGVQERMRVMEAAVLALTSKPNPAGQESHTTGRQTREPSGEPCRLWNRGGAALILNVATVMCAAAAEGVIRCAHAQRKPGMSAPSAPRSGATVPHTSASTRPPVPGHTEALLAGIERQK